VRKKRGGVIRRLKKHATRATARRDQTVCETFGLDQPNTNAVIKDAALEQLAGALAAKLRTESWDSIRPIIEDREGPKAQALLDCFEELKSLVKLMGVEPDGGE
jgi:hypothetical protein